MFSHMPCIHPKESILYYIYINHYYFNNMHANSQPAKLSGMKECVTLRASPINYNVRGHYQHPYTHISTRHDRLLLIYPLPFPYDDAVLLP